MKLIKALNYFFDQAAKVLFFLIIVLVFFAAVVRWIGYPVAWSIDLAQLFFGWVVFLGADYTLRENGHIGIDYITGKLSPKIQRIIMIINYCIILVFLAVITGYGVYLCVLNAERKFNVLQISYSYATASVPAGCFLMSITVVCKLVSLFSTDHIKTDPVPGNISGQETADENIKEVDKCC